MNLTVAGAVLLAGLAVAFAQDASPPLSRRYQDGERLSYVMSGHNDGRTFEVRLNAVVKRDAAGQFVEEFSWSDLAWGGMPEPMTAASREFRQTVTLSGRAPFAFPNLSVVQPGLIGPITDLLTYYADLFLATHVAKLSKPGDRFYWPNPSPNSWADGTTVVLGENAIDFDITLTSIDRATATVLIRHVPPQEPSIQIPVAWMREPVADTPNNWVEVGSENGKYRASIGKETFDVRLTVDRETGAIVSAVMDNVVDAVERECADRALTDCGERRPHRIVRRIELKLAPNPSP